MRSVLHTFVMSQLLDERQLAESEIGKDISLFVCFFIERDSNYDEGIERYLHSYNCAWSGLLDVVLSLSLSPYCNDSCNDFIPFEAVRVFWSLAD